MRMNSLCLLLIAALTTTLHGQTLTGCLRGVVQDSAAARIVGATIEIKSADISIARRISSDVRGEFLLQDLNPGLYHFSVTAAGFAPASADVSVPVSTMHDITVTMRAPTVQQTASVQARGSSIATTPVDISSNVQQRALLQNGVSV